MFKLFILAILQAITEFLPISSSGHLAIFSNLFSDINVFLFTFLHLASLFAVIIFLRKDIVELFFNKESKKKIFFIIIGILPSIFFGYFFYEFIEKTFSSFLYIGIFYLFMGFVLILTKFTNGKKDLNLKSSFIIGLTQIFALFPGISRSGITISTAKFLKIKDEEAFKFSFLMFIPLSLGAFLYELTKLTSTHEFYYNSFSLKILISFFICFVFSLISLNIVKKILKKEKFWLFGFYCFFIGIVSLILYFLN